MDKKIKVLLDMDGTLLFFPSEHGELGTQKYKTEKGFFKNLKPFKDLEKLVEFINSQKDNSNIEFYIISTSPHEMADTDKTEWQKLFFNCIDEKNIFYNRHTESKADFIKRTFDVKTLDSTFILVDDYKKNLLIWQENGGRGVRMKNENVDSFYNGEEVTSILNLVEFLNEVK